MTEKEYPEDGELVLCTVETIEKTLAFVKLDDYNKTGVLVTSEISPGRIRNIRDFIVPNKKIVCKVLRVDKERNHIDVSLRRVNLKEKKDVLEKYKKEKDAVSILGRVLDKSKIDDAVKKIKSEFKSLAEFFSSAKDELDLFKKFGLEEEAKKLAELIKERIKTKRAIVKSKFEIKVGMEYGITELKKILNIQKPGVKITYISSPIYLVTAESTDYKTANKLLQETLAEIEAKIKKMGGHIDIESE